MEDFVHKPLEGLCGISYSEWHSQEFKKSERGCDGFNWDLVICSDKVNM